MSEMYDLLILGAGPAGITAAVYAARKKINFALVSQDIGGQAAWSGDVENYTGYQFISGPELALKFQEHMEGFGIPVNMPETVRAVRKDNDVLQVHTDVAEYQARTLIIATGKRPRPLGVPGEQEFRNRGVAYCATCDGPLFKGKPVAVIGGGNSGLDAALQLMKISPRVYLIEVGPSLRGDECMRQKILQADTVEVLTQTEVTAIHGQTFVNELVVRQRDNERRLTVNGIFVEIGLIPNTDFSLPVACNEKKEIIVDTHNRTDVPGIFAAGDVTDVPEKQIIIACGEGAKSCLGAFHYLATHSFT